MTPSTIPRTPFPFMVLKSVSSPMVMPWCFAALIIPRPIGCSLFCSRVAASFNKALSLRVFLMDCMWSTPNSPLVKVPVLSKTIVSIDPAFSKAVLLRISSPFCALMAVERATTSGVARPSACGQAMTITVAIRAMAKVASPLMKDHVIRVVNPAPIAM